MIRIFKWIGIILGTLIGLLIIATIVLSFTANQNLNRVYVIESPAITIPSDTDISYIESIARGKHIVHAIAACTSCHGPELEGEVFVDGMPMGIVVASNLTAGAGGIGATYSDDDWLHALRNGISPDGTALLPMMPTDSFHALSDTDLGAVVAYLKSIPPVNHELPATKLAFPGRIIMGVLDQNTFPANFLPDAEAPPVTSPTGVTVEHGEYLAAVGSCRYCHGAQFNGGQVDPDALLGPNLTSGGHLGEWSQEDFTNAIRTGLRPDGTPIDPFMPWPKYRNMADSELEAIWLYLQSLEPLASALD